MTKKMYFTGLFLTHLVRQLLTNNTIIARFAFIYLILCSTISSPIIALEFVLFSRNTKIYYIFFSHYKTVY